MLKNHTYWVMVKITIKSSFLRENSTWAVHFPRCLTGRCVRRCKLKIFVTNPLFVMMQKPTQTRLSVSVQTRTSQVTQVKTVAVTIIRYSHTGRIPFKNIQRPPPLNRTRAGGSVLGLSVFLQQWINPPCYSQHIPFIRLYAFSGTSATHTHTHTHTRIGKYSSMHYL